MKLLAVVTLPPIYHGCSTQKKLWERKLPGKKDFFLSVNMKNCGRWNVRKHKEIRGNDKYVALKKHKEIRGSDNYVTLEISSKFDSLDKMKISSSESKGRLKPREVINPFPDLSNLPFDSEDEIFILSRLSNFDEISKVT